MPVTYKPTNVVISPFIRYSGTSAYSATSSDFLPVTLRFLPDQQETTGGDEVKSLLDSGSLAGDFIAKVVPIGKLKIKNQKWRFCSCF